MAKVKITPALRSFFPELTDMQIPATTVKEVVAVLERKHPGISSYLLTEQGSLRNHVNIYLQNTLVSDRQQLSDSVGENDEVLIYQALSGG